MLKTKVQSEISTKEHLAGNFKSAEPEQPLDGQPQTLVLPDARSKLGQERQKANGRNGTPPIDALPTQPADSELAQLRVDWSNLSPLERSERVKVLIANGHSRRGLAKVIGCSEGSIRQHLRFSHLTDEERQAFEEGSMSGKKALRKAQERKVQERLAQLRVSQQDWTREINRLVKVNARLAPQLGSQQALPGAVHLRTSWRAVQHPSCRIRSLCAETLGDPN